MGDISKAKLSELEIADIPYYVAKGITAELTVAAKKLGVDEWMLKLVSMNPDYTEWTNAFSSDNSTAAWWDVDLSFGKWRDFGPWQLDDYNDVFNYSFELNSDGVSTQLVLYLWMMHARKGAVRKIRIDKIKEGDAAEVVKFLITSADRNTDRFRKLLKPVVVNNSDGKVWIFSDANAISELAASAPSELDADEIGVILDILENGKVTSLKGLHYKYLSDFDITDIDTF